MIIDTIDNAANYINLNSDFKLVFDYIKNNNLLEMSCGKHEIRGSEVFVNLQEYDTKYEQKLEAHKKYIDIQIVVKGSEYIGYADIGKTSIKEEYNAEKDVMFLSGSIDKFKADDKTFVIFYPQDAHMPALCIDKPGHVRKAVFKILKF